MIIALLFALSAPDDAAARAEEAAFIAIDEKRWCDAWREFMRAHELAPADELLFNAALAAERAGDVEKARELFARVPASSPKGESAQRHLADMKDAASTATCEATTTKAPPPPVEETPKEERTSGMGTLPLGLAGAAGVVTVAGILAIAAGTAVY